MYFIVGMISFALGGWTMQWAVYLGNRQRASRQLRADRRLGLLGTGDGLSAEAHRAARLKELGTAGTYRVYNCGKILHVDYDRGELVVEKTGRESAF